MKKLLLLILLLSINAHSQDSLRVNQVYFEKGLCYKAETGTLFSGKTQSYKHKNHLVYEKNFIDGQIKKYTIYFNGKKGKFLKKSFMAIMVLKKKELDTNIQLILNG